MFHEPSGVLGLAGTLFRRPGPGSGGCAGSLATEYVTLSKSFDFSGLGLSIWCSLLWLPCSFLYGFVIACFLQGPV